MLHDGVPDRFLLILILFWRERFVALSLQKVLLYTIMAEEQPSMPKQPQKQQERRKTHKRKKPYRCYQVYFAWSLLLSSVRYDLKFNEI